MSSFGILIFISALCTTANALSAYEASPLADTNYGQTTTLNYLGSREDPSLFRHLNAEIFHWSDTICRLRVVPERLTSGQSSPYRVPETVFQHSNTDSSTFAAASNPSYEVRVDQENDLSSSLMVRSRTSGEELFRVGNLTYREQQVSLSFNVQTNSYLSGFGEHDYYYFLNHNHIPGSVPFETSPAADWSTQTIHLGLWNTDNGFTPWQRPLYGVHPVLFVQQPVTSTFFAVFFMNSNAQGISIHSQPFNFSALSASTFRQGSEGVELTFIGGIIDAFVIMGSSPRDVIAQYHKLITPTMLPPYWSLGVHQSRWGYKDVDDLKAVVAGYAANDLPLETMWTDIDYMDKFRIFTLDPENYPLSELRPFIDSLHQNSQRYVQIVDPGVAQANYSVWRNGTANDVWVKMSDNTSALVNVVWPGWTVFPDFTAEHARNWWGSQMANYLKSVPLDGIWLDMNELGTFCGGSCNVTLNTPWQIDWQNPTVWKTFETNICVAEGHCTRANSSLNYPPINPTDSLYPFVFNRTLDMTGVLAMGKYYDTKAFYGMMEEKATFDQLLKNKTRPFILSRATFVGSGKYTAHWTGDNSCTWKPTEGGISDTWQGIMSANLWGIAMVGSDIGGYSGTSTKQLITRWTQAGAFYTFMRNHHQKDDTHQEPYTCSATEIAAIRKAMLKRYELLPYIFTELAQSHFLGGAVTRHLSVEFPSDIATYVERNTFMLGSSVLVVPVTVQDAQTTTSYLPRGPWYDVFTLAVVSINGQQQKVFNTPFDLGSSTVSDIPAMFRGGSVVPMHTTPQLTVAATRSSGVSLLVAFDLQNFAEGEGLFDDGKESILEHNAYENGKMLRMKYSCVGRVEEGQCQATTLSTGPAPHSFPLLPIGTRATLTIVFPITNVSAGALPQPRQVRINDVAIDLANVTTGTTWIRILLPEGTDGTKSFKADWTMTPVIAPTPAPPPPPKGSPVVALIIVIILLGLLAGAAFLGMFYFRKKANEATSSDFIGLA